MTEVVIQDQSEGVQHGPETVEDIPQVGERFEGFGSTFRVDGVREDFEANGAGVVRRIIVDARHI